MAGREFGRQRDERDNARQELEEVELHRERGSTDDVCGLDVEGTRGEENVGKSGPQGASRGGAGFGGGSGDGEASVLMVLGVGEVKERWCR